MDAIMLDGEVGSFVSREHQRVAEILQDYDPSLTVVFIPLDKREGLDEFPYAVYYSPDDGREKYIVRRVRQEDMNENLVAWVFSNDQNHRSVDDILAAHDAANEALRLKRKMEHQEVLEARKDFAKSVLNGKNYFKHNGRVYR